MNDAHFITKCRECNETIVQCSCMGGPKQVQYDICQKCAEKAAKASKS